MGDSGVGKSSIILRYFRNEFLVTIQSTTGIDYQFTTKKIEDKPVTLEIWDTTGQQKYYSICTNQIKGAHVAILVYDLSREFTINVLQDRWIPVAEENIPADGFFVIFGNKDDLIAEDP